MVYLRRKSRSVITKLFHNREFRAGAILLGFVIITALVGPFLPIGAPNEQDLSRVILPPVWMSGGSSCLEDLLGTDPLGRSTLSRLVFGARISLMVGLTSVLIAGLIGVPAGLLAGYYGGAIDAVLMRIADIQLAFPPVLLALAIVATFGGSLANVTIAIAVTSWVPYARVIRGSVLSLKERDYIVACQALGASNFRILLLHVLPNILTPVLVVATLQVGRAIVTESALSYLGLGVPAPAPSWGAMLSDARNYIYTAWWLPTFPGLAIMMTVLGINLVGNGLQAVLDPKLRV